MKFVKVNEVPEVKKYHHLKDYFEGFMDSNIKIAKVELNNGDYTSTACARTVLYAAIKRHGFPINIMKRGDEIYLVRRDM